MNEAVIIDVNGDLSILTGSPTLEKAQKTVGGYVQLIGGRNPQTGESGQLLMDEEGKLKNLPVNQVATMFIIGDVIVGTVIWLTGDKQWK